jgi:hypothetical protein
MERRSFTDWSFGHYLRIAHPSLAVALPASRARPALRAVA